MKQYFSWALALSLALSVSIASAAPKSSEPLDRIVAIVNEGVITQAELDAATTKATRQLTLMHTALPSTAILKKQVLDQLINHKLQLELAKQMGIQISDEELSKAIATIANNNHISTPQLYGKLAEEGLSKTSYRTEIREEMTLQRVEQEVVGSKISVSQEDVQRFIHSAAWRTYNTKEYHLEDILIAVPENPSSEAVAAAKKRAEALIEKLHHGLRFEEAAASDSSNNALEGGDLGWRKLPEIPTAFTKELVQMNENDIFGPIQTPNGFHIVHVKGLRSANTKSNATNQRKQVENLLFQRKFEEALQTWLIKLRSEAYINITLDS